MKLTDSSGFSEWTPDKWCVAVHQLCTSYVKDMERYPEQWLYFLWRPSNKAMPYRDPDCIGYAVGDPFDQIQEAIQKEPLYLLQEEECYWPAMLELTLMVDNLEDWVAELVCELQREKRRDVHERWLRRYSDASEENEELAAHESNLPERITVDESGFDPSCACLNNGVRNLLTCNIGIDTVNSSYGKVTTSRCRDCGRHWLCFFIEYEAFTNSGRWYEGLIEQPYLDRMTPELAIPYLSRLDWYLCGGSYFDGKVFRSRGTPRL